MGKVSIAVLLLSTGVMLVTFGRGITLLRGGEVATYLQWALVALIVVLCANAVAMVHAAQSDRIIRQLRRHATAGTTSEPPADPAR
jgi:uncharacterized membrane protein YidH (DUF202 family)